MPLRRFPAVAKRDSKQRDSGTEFAMARTAQINPQILAWARETAGLTIEEAAEKLGLKDVAKASAAEKSAQAQAEAGTRPVSQTFLDKALHLSAPAAHLLTAAAPGSPRCGGGCARAYGARRIGAKPPGRPSARRLPRSARRRARGGGQKRPCSSSEVSRRAASASRRTRLCVRCVRRASPDRAGMSPALFRTCHALGSSGRSATPEGEIAHRATPVLPRPVPACSSQP